MCLAHPPEVHQASNKRPAEAALSSCHGHAGAGQAAEAAQLTRPCQLALEQRVLPLVVLALQLPSTCGQAQKLLAAMLQQQPVLADTMTR